MMRIRRDADRGFTLVELLVVVGIIAVLIGVLLPVLSSARKSGYRIKCLANLKTLGDAYKLYASDTKGYWPPAWIQYQQVMPPFSSSGYADKRWFDFIGKYVVGGMIGNQEINWNGTQGTGPEPKEPQIWTEPIWHSDNAIWGCPMWDRVGRNADGSVSHVEGGNAILWPGYLQNPYPFAPKYSPNTIVLGSTNPVPRGFYRATQYTRQAERALLFEAVSHTFNIGSGATAGNWPYKPEGAEDWPKTPKLGMPVDFNRHGRHKIGNKQTDTSLNMLFCDGHAEAVSARQAWKAISFK